MHILKINKLKDKIKKFFHKIQSKDYTTNVIYLPGFEDQKRFEDQYLRLIWYIYPIIDSIDKIYIPIAKVKVSTNTKINIPYYLDQNILKFEKKVKSKIEYFEDQNMLLWEDSLSKSKISLMWDVEKKYNNNIDYLIEKYKKKMKNWRIDHNNVQFAASLFLKFSSEFDKNIEKNLLESQNTFDNFIKNIKRLKLNKSYIFGTGPSLDEASSDSIDFNDGITIACNSMVKNQALLQKLNPKLFVASDPIFHAGCSSYAEEYRKHLFISMDTFTEALLVVPFRDFLLYRQNFPKRFYKRIVGIPFKHREDTNFNISKEFNVKSTSNVMTNLLIPLATTISTEIYMMGYDGRKMEDNEYYWDHNKKAQFNEKMESIQVAHPSFFTVDYDDYYIEHCETLEKIFISGENKGYNFFNLSHSYIPALVKRFKRS